MAIRSLTLSVVAASLLALPVAAQESSIPPVGIASAGEKTAPESAEVVARKFIQRADAVLAARPTFGAEFETITTFDAPYRDLRETGTLVLQRPGQLRIEIDRWRRVREGMPWEQTGNGSVAVSDGATGWNLTRHPESAQYQQEAASDVWRDRTLSMLLPVQAFFGGTARFAEALSALRYVGKRDWQSETFDVVTARDATGSSAYTLWFDAECLLRRVEVERPPIAPDTGKGKAVYGGREAFRRRDIRLLKTNVPSEHINAAFAFNPPPGAVKIAPGTRRADATLTVGDAAPDFTVADESGKPVHLSDFRGKVVVLKFWATWCWPCRQSWPETERVARAASDDVVVLTVALYDSPKAFTNWVSRYRHDARSGLPASLHFAFDGRPQGQDVASSLYGISATPTLLVIGRDGNIRAAFSGYSGPSTLLDDAVKAAVPAANR